MKYTLLEMVQLILSSLDSDEVNSISDTPESNQVALLLKSVYYDSATDLGLPEHETLFQLNASGDASKPTIMYVPTNVTHIDWISYNNVDSVSSDTNDHYEKCEYIPFELFQQQQQSIRNASTGVDSLTYTQNGQTFTHWYYTDRMPTKYTSTDNYTLLFDAYKSTVDTTLQQSKSQCHGVVYPTWSMTDSFTPDLGPTQFSFLVNRAKVRAFAELKQAPNQEAIAEARRQKIIVQKRKRTVPNRPEVFNVARFGRREQLNAIPRRLRNAD